MHEVADEGIRREIAMQLDRAGTGGLARGKLIKGKSKDKEVRTTALDVLITRREVINIGTEAKPHYMLARHYQPLELAYAAIETAATPGVATVFTQKDFEKALKAELKKQKGVATALKAATVKKLGEAVQILERETKLIRLRPATSKAKQTTLYLHTASLNSLGLLLTPTKAAGQSNTEPSVSPEAVRRAYDQLSQEQRFPDILIADLQRRSGIPLEALKAWLREQSRSGEAVPTLGDWSLASAEERQAALEIGGEQYLQVRFKS